MSRPLRWLSVATAPFVWLLDRSSALIFRLLGLDRESRNQETAEELHLVVAEAQTAGVLEEDERAMISGIVRLADRPVREVMTPRT
jgi:putative hemolysin